MTLAKTVGMKANFKLEIMKNKTFISLGILCLLTSCVKGLDDTNFIPTPGNEVVLTARLGTPKTKTVYGEEGETSIPVKWVHNDLITVYGTTCSVPQADYAVKTYVKDANGGVTDQILSSTPNKNDGQNYADDLVKTGEAGVQWGTLPKSDFYAVYPAVTGNIAQTTTGVTVPATISSQQYNSFSVIDGVLVGTPFHPENKTYGMDDAIMYAYTKDATPTDENGNPKAVDLRFKPFSTVMKFHIGTWYAQSGSSLESDQHGKSIKVNAITLEAPYNVAGDFTLSLDGNDATAAAGTTKKISIIPAEEIVWTYGQELEFCVFVIPVAGQKISGSWKVTITANDGSRTFSLKPKTNDNATIEPGMIHKLNVEGFPVTEEWKYDPATWLTTVPRNIYISDISLPGAWYATDSGYQDGSLQQQYNAGIRAFNIDCRLTLNTSTSVGKANGKTGITNYLNKDWREYVDNTAHALDGTLVLACSGTEDGSLGKISSIGKTVKQALKELGTLAMNNPNEYVEAIITVAQKPNDENTGYTYIRGTVNPQMVLNALANLLNNDKEIAQYIYGYGDGKTITPETTVGDVCGKVVVKVNLNTNDAHLKTYNYSAPMLISEGSMASSSIGYISGDIVSGSFTGMNTAEMYWSNSYPAAGNSIKPMKYYYHQAQATTGTPTIADRKTAIQSILSKSYEIYSRNTHDAMFQLGIGGWTSDNNSGKTNLSSELNPYVYGIINSMLTETQYEGKVYKPAPVGAVLMNFATAGTNVDNDVRDTRKLIKAIIDLNGKYFLNRDTSKPAWPSINGGNDEGGQDDPNQPNGSGTGSGGGSEGDQGEF